MQVVDAVATAIGDRPVRAENRVVCDLPEEQVRKYFDEIPELAERFDDWKDVLRFFFQNSEEMEEQMRRMWQESRKAALEEGGELTPQEFARRVVKDTFEPLIDEAARRKDELRNEREGGD